MRFIFNVISENIICPLAPHASGYKYIIHVFVRFDNRGVLWGYMRGENKKEVGRSQPLWFLFDLLLLYSVYFGRFDYLRGFMVGNNSTSRML